MSPSDLLVLAAAGMFVLGYLILDQILLRIMLLIGTALYIWYYAIVDSSPLWPAIWASLATGSANLIGLIKLIYRRSAWAIPRQYRDLYENFKALPPGDFARLVTAAKHVTRPAGYPMTRANEPIETLYYVINGQVEIEKDGARFAISNGVFVGEVGYLTRKPASASTVVAKNAELLEWDVKTLRKRVKRDPRFGLAMDTMISLDLAEKVAKAGAPVLSTSANPSSPLTTPEFSRS